MNFFRIAVALLVPAVFLACSTRLPVMTVATLTLRSSHGSTASKAGRGHAAPTPTARSSPMSIGNLRMATTAYGSGANGSTFPTML